HCRLAKETIVSQTSQTKSRVTLSFRFSPLKPASFSQPQSSTRSPEIRNNNGLRMSVENQPRPAKSLKSLLPTQFFLQNRGFAPETSLAALQKEAQKITKAKASLERQLNAISAAVK